MTTRPFALVSVLLFACGAAASDAEAPPASAGAETLETAETQNAEAEAEPEAATGVDDALASELASAFARFRADLDAAIAAGDARAAMALLGSPVPADTPEQELRQALPILRAMASSMGDPAEGVVVHADQENDRARLVYRSEPDADGGFSVSVVRFRRGEDGWHVHGPQRTTAQPRDESMTLDAQVEAIVRDPSFAIVPSED